jgi:hypothetical protein
MRMDEKGEKGVTRNMLLQNVSEIIKSTIPISKALNKPHLTIIIYINYQMTMMRELIN